MNQLILKERQTYLFLSVKTALPCPRACLLLFETLAPKPAPVKGAAELSWKLTKDLGVGSWSPVFTAVESVALLN